jgi:hypothetical protein
MDELREKGVHGSNQQNKLFKDDAERITVNFIYLLKKLYYNKAVF